MVQGLKEKLSPLGWAPAAQHSEDTIAPDMEAPTTGSTLSNSGFEKGEAGGETFQNEGYRNLSWIRTSFIFLKLLFATGVLALPLAFATLGAVGACLVILGFGLFNGYNGMLQAEYRLKHPHCHSIADIAYDLGLRSGFKNPRINLAIARCNRELAGFCMISTWVLVVAGGIIALSTAFNVFSNHSICTIGWNFIAAVIIALVASFPKLHEIGWLSYFGFVSIYAAVLIVVIAVTQNSRPAIAPPTGPFELGFYVTASSTFGDGMTASSTIFYSTAGTAAFLPVISEMRNPREYWKPLVITFTVVTASYIAFGEIIYYWCGKWIASPALGVSLKGPSRPCFSS